MWIEKLSILIKKENKKPNSYINKNFLNKINNTNNALQKAPSRKQKTTKEEIFANHVRHLYL